MSLPSFCFVGALYVAWILFYVGLFSVRTFFFSQTCKNLLSRVSTRCRHRFGAEGTKTLQEIIPDLLIDICFLSTALGGGGGRLSRGTRTLADVKIK
jgi:hypothetical protein